MGPPNANHLRVGDLLARSVRIYLRNFLPFLPIAAIAYAPWLLLELWSPMVEDTTMATLIWFGWAVVEESCHFVLAGVLSIAVVQQLRGRATVHDLTRGLHAVPPALGAAVLAAVRVQMWILLGTLLAQWSAYMGTIYLALLSFPLWILALLQVLRLFVTMPASVLEKRTALAALRRSAQLTKGVRGPIFGAWLMLMAAQLLVMQALGYLLVDNVDVMFPLRFYLLPQWITATVKVVFAPLMATAMATAWFLLRRSVDQVDADDIAAVFD